jgi:ubiquinone/menaquinone biosynthesis C-methylase UbiE
MTEYQGDASSFDKNWRLTEEAYYLHWTRTAPSNQIQLAFYQHWLTFKEIMGDDFKGRKVLEVGCGRGSLSAYFSDSGWDCTLLDISPTAIELARKAFLEHGLKAKFDVGDCLSLPYENESFDVTFSIGLLEHFEQIDNVIREQIRVLAPGGLFIGYVVPHMTTNIQREYRWFNDVLRALIPKDNKFQKTEVFRSETSSAAYIQILKDLGLKKIGASGTYPIPMISHSTAFPFSLLPPKAEEVLVAYFTGLLEQRREKNGGSNPWLCDEDYGQAFLVWGFKG